MDVDSTKSQRLQPAREEKEVGLVASPATSVCHSAIDDTQLLSHPNPLLSCNLKDRWTMSSSFCQCNPSQRLFSFASSIRTAPELNPDKVSICSTSSQKGE